MEGETAAPSAAAAALMAAMRSGEGNDALKLAQANARNSATDVADSSSTQVRNGGPEKGVAPDPRKTLMKALTKRIIEDAPRGGKDHVVEGVGHNDEEDAMAKLELKKTLQSPMMANKALAMTTERAAFIKEIRRGQTRMLEQRNEMYLLDVTPPPEDVKKEAEIPESLPENEEADLEGGPDPEFLTKLRIEEDGESDAGDLSVEGEQGGYNPNFLGPCGPASMPGLGSSEVSPSVSRFEHLSAVESISEEGEEEEEDEEEEDLISSRFSPSLDDMGLLVAAHDDGGNHRSSAELREETRSFLEKVRGLELSEPDVEKRKEELRRLRKKFDEDEQERVRLYLEAKKKREAEKKRKRDEERESRRALREKERQIRKAEKAAQTAELLEAARKRREAEREEQRREKQRKYQEKLAEYRRKLEEQKREWAQPPLRGSAVSRASKPSASCASLSHVERSSDARNESRRLGRKGQSRSNGTSMRSASSHTSSEKTKSNPNFTEAQISDLFSRLHSPLKD